MTPNEEPNRSSYNKHGFSITTLEGTLMPYLLDD